MARRTLHDTVDAVPTAAPVPASSKPTFFSYVDAQGVEHLVDALDKVPAPQRATAKRWHMEDGHGDDAALGAMPSLPNVLPWLDGSAERPTPATMAGTPTSSPSPATSPATAALGASDRSIADTAPPPPQAPWPLLIAALAAAAVYALLKRRRAPLVLRALVALLGVTAAGATYVGWVRGQSGLDSQQAVQTPADFVDHARRAKTLVEGQLEDRAKVLDTLEGAR